MNCADASEHQTAIDAEESEGSQRIADMNPPSGFHIGAADESSD